MKQSLNYINIGRSTIILFFLSLIFASQHAYCEANSTQKNPTENTKTTGTITMEHNDSTQQDPFKRKYHTSTELYGPFGKAVLAKISSKKNYLEEYRKMKEKDPSWRENLEYVRTGEWDSIPVKILDINGKETEGILWYAMHKEKRKFPRSPEFPPYIGILISEGVVSWVGLSLPHYAINGNKSLIGFLFFLKVDQKIFAIAGHEDRLRIQSSFIEEIKEKLSNTPETAILDVLVKSIRITKEWLYEDGGIQYFDISYFFGHGIFEDGATIGKIYWEWKMLEKGLLYFKIENRTHNRYGEIWLDTEKMEIVKKEETGNPTRDNYCFVSK